MDDLVATAESDHAAINDGGGAVDVVIGLVCPDDRSIGGEKAASDAVITVDE